MTATFIPPAPPRESPSLRAAVARYHRDPPTPGWARWLARGQGDTAELRRWALWVWWSGLARTHGRRQAWLALARRPQTLLRDTKRLVRQHGAAAQAAGAPPPRRQLGTILSLWTRYQLPPSLYYSFHLWRPDRAGRAGAFLPVTASSTLIYVCRYTRHAEENRLVTSDKTVFEAWCAAHGFPSTATLATIHADTDADSIAALPPVDLFAKPTNARCGQGASRWCRVAGGWSSAAHGAAGVLDQPALIAWLSEQSATSDRPLLVQRCLSNHAALAHVTNGGVCTVRVITACGSGHPNTSPAEVVRAIYRMPTGTTAADNFDAGGIAASVNLETGELGVGVRKKGTGFAQPLMEHPDTSGTISGSRIPGWPGVLALAVEAHARLGIRAPIIGWDVAVTADGPVLIEANAMPCITLAQLPSGEPLGGTAYTEALVAYLRDTFLR